MHLSRTPAGRDAEADTRKAVLVTEASTGIGRKFAERLASEGHFVYAGARIRSDLQMLEKIENVTALHLDVTTSENVVAAAKKVAADRCGLDGLVNNAGVATYGSVVDRNEKEFDLVVAVNVYGPYRITRAFAPLIVAKRGRVVTVGSISGILADRNLRAYSMSKHSTGAFTDSLALEMESLDVHVSDVERDFNSNIERTPWSVSAGIQCCRWIAPTIRSLTMWPSRCTGIVRAATEASIPGRLGRGRSSKNHKEASCATGRAELGVRIYIRSERTHRRCSMRRLHDRVRKRQLDRRVRA
jgi:NAD(P)-dependent dehydrogenase (short-subunit alcohol dehydrogenase family)